MGIFSVETIKSTLSQRGDVAKSYLYTAQITPPASLIGKYNMLHLSILTESASIPGRQIMTTPFTIFGTHHKYPYGTVYEDLSLEFICTQSMYERRFFDDWQSLIHNTTNHQMKYMDDYSGTIVLDVYKDSGANAGTGHATRHSHSTGVDGEISAKYIFIECFPISIESQSLSYDNTEMLKLSVSFAYRLWKNEIVENSESSEDSVKEILAF